MVKQFLPKEMKEKLQFGCVFSDRLDKTFLVPDPYSAKLRNYGRIMETIKKRYDNEKNFKL